MPQVLDWRNTVEHSSMVQQAAQALADGRLVVFPTETVYSVAASALDAAAVERLRACAPSTKGRPLPIALHSSAVAIDWIPQISCLARRLIRRCWPGPMTLLAPDGTTRGLASRLPQPIQEVLCANGGMALRAPDHEAARQVLMLTGGPVVLQELASMAGPASPHEAAAELGEEVLILDDGPCRFGKPATVVAVQGDRWQVIHEGVLSACHIQQLTAQVVLFVCTGNTCRSPLAEALCKKVLAERLECAVGDLPQRGFIVLSAGLGAMMGDRASAEAVAVAEEFGADLSGHTSRTLSDALVAQADHLIAMTASHSLALTSRFGPLQPQPRLLCGNGGDLDDPIGGDRAVYRRCAEQIQEHVRMIVAEMLQP